MPWKETCPMDERVKFIGMYLEGELSMVELCRQFGVERKTGYKWVHRYEQGGPAGLVDRSRAPHHHPNAVVREIEDAIVTLRGRRPRWGPKKLRVKLGRREPPVSWPAASTIGEILQRHGLVVSRRRKRRTPPYVAPLLSAEQPNDVWCADFKGWFRTGDGSRCDPFTLSDSASRLLLRCQAVLHPDEESVRPVLDAAFREFGLPRAIRTDNGPPFATTTVRGLSRLSVWWIKLGIVPERIEPAKPAQNGRHERLHRTLKQETASPPARTLRLQQRAFDQFREYDNHDRPHEALEQQTPHRSIIPRRKNTFGRCWRSPIPRAILSVGSIRRATCAGETASSISAKPWLAKTLASTKSVTDCGIFTGARCCWRSSMTRPATSTAPKTKKRCLTRKKKLH